jgi:diguanylate cyclase (GGDEF)-like protein
MLSKTAPNALPCHLASFEIEHFEEIAVEYGDATAEALLIGVADRLADNIRRIDSIGRIGRNTFGICMASISLANATVMCDRLRNCIAEEPFATPSGRMNITVGIGISAIDADSQSASDIIARAGNSRHTAHKSGRRRIGIEQLRIRP